MIGIRPVVYIFLILQGVGLGLSGVAGLFFLLDVGTEWLGWIWAATSFPGIMAWMLLVLHFSREKHRKAVCSPENVLADWQIEKSAWESWLAFMERQRKDENISLSATFIGAGLLASWLKFIPIPWYGGLGIGAYLAISAIGLKWLWNKQWAWVKNDEDRRFVISKIGLLQGGVVHFWHADEGELLSIEWVENAQTLLPTVKFEYVKTTYSRHSGYKRIPQPVFLPVPNEKNHVVESWIRDFKTWKMSTL